MTDKEKVIQRELDAIHREYLHITTTDLKNIVKNKAQVKKKATKLGYRLVESMFGCHFEKMESPQDADRVISVMESEWKRLKEIEKMYFEMLKESEK